jgi:hypothetical protein
MMVGKFEESRGSASTDAGSDSVLGHVDGPPSCGEVSGFCLVKQERCL